MPQDAFSLLATAGELDKKLKNARIDKINQPNDDTVVFNVRADRENLKLVICANARFNRIAITSDDKQNPLSAPNFCMLLRKHLSHAVIKKIELVNLERIVKITFECKNELRESGEKCVYAEIMGKYSNIILVENGYVLGALKQSALDVSNKRPILSGVKYVLPISQEKTEITDRNAVKNKLLEFTGLNPDLFIFNNFKGIAKSTASEIVYSYSEKVHCDDFVKIFKTDDFIDYFISFYVSPKIVPNMTEKDFYITDYRTVQTEKKYFSTINEAIDCFYSFSEKKQNSENKRIKLNSIVAQYEKKLQKKLQIVYEKELSCNDMEELRLYGELIMSNLYRLKKPVKTVTLIDYSKADYPEVEIRLDENLTPKENAEKFFKKYSKLKKTLVAVAPQKAELTESLNYVSTLFSEINEAESNDDFNDIEEELGILGIIKKSSGKKERVKSSKPRSYNFRGYDILVGRNNLQNDRLTLGADRSDVFLHTKNYHSAHVIIKTDGRNVPDEVLLYAAEICAYFSSAKNSDKVPVDYTLKKFVKKPPDANTGKVFYTNQKTILVTPNKH